MFESVSDPIVTYSHAIRQIVSVDPKQLIIKRIILTGAQLTWRFFRTASTAAMAVAGYPFRTQKNKAVVRTQE